VRKLVLAAFAALLLVGCGSEGMEQAVKERFDPQVVDAIRLADCKGLDTLERRYQPDDQAEGRKGDAARQYLGMIDAQRQVKSCGQATTTTAQDPGVAACKTVARRAKAGVTPTDVQRAAAWRQLQASGHAELRASGAKLRQAWTAGDLADQVEANTNAAMACALYGVEIKVG
jgi:hypothetical protein